MRRKAQFTALLLLLCPAGRAGAEPLRSLALSFEACRAEDAAEVRRLVAIDFGAIESADHATYSLLIRCRESTWELSLAAAALARSLDFSSTAENARARLAAIVVGELVAEASTEGDAPVRKPQPVSASPPASPRDVRPPSAARDRFRASALGGGRTLLGGVPRLLGAAARFEDLVVPWSLDALLEQGAVTTSEGVVSMRSLSGGLSLSWQASLASAQVRVGGGVRAGAVWMRGEPQGRAEIAGQTLLRGWAGPMLTSALALPFSRRLAFELVVEGGYTLLPVYGLVDGRREAALSGVWLGAQAGAGIAF